VNDEHLREVLSRLPSESRDRLKILLVADAEDRDRVAQKLLRSGSDVAGNFADILDTLTLDDGARRHVLRVLGELEAST
jgi:hypothetical protein